MENKYQYKFIEGDFSSEEAKTVLMTLINNKINFHNLNSFSDHVKNNGSSEKAKKRIAELTITRDAILELMEKAEKEGKKLSIKSDISIELI